MRYLSLLAVLLGLFVFAGRAQAQSAAQRNAAYFATVKAVSDYKINDEEIIGDIASLRQNQQFNRDLQRMMEKLSNSRSKDGKNKRVYDILERAGKDIYDILK